MGDFGTTTTYQTWTRDTSKDTTVYDTPATLYTDSTTLAVNMPLYDNTGTVTTEAIDTIIDAESFTILPPLKKVNVEGFSYNVDSKGKMSITGYTGSGTSIVVPILEDL